MGRRGLSLLETVIASVIFAIVAVSLAVLFGSANHGTTRGIYQLGANSLATSLVEQAFDDAKGGRIPEATNGVFEIKTIRRGFESTLDLNYEVAVTNVNVGLHDVLVTVSWTYQDQNFEIEREVLVSPRP